MKKLLGMLLLGSALSLAALPQPAEGAARGARSASVHQDKAVSEIKAEVLVLHATNDGKGIDPGIGDIPELKKPPFSSFDTYKLIGKSTVTLPKGKTQDASLPDGGKLRVTFNEAEGEKASKFSLKAAVEKSDGTEFASVVFKTPRSKYFFLAGPKHGKGILVVGIKVL